MSSRRRLLNVAAIAVAMTACSGEPSGPPRLDPSYALHRVNGQPLPFFLNSVLIGSESCQVDVLGGGATFEQSFRFYSVSLGSRTTCGTGLPQNGRVDNEGRFELVGSEIRWSPTFALNTLTLLSGTLRNGRVLMQVETFGQTLQLDFGEPIR
jgi:hypothetical protein